MTQESYIKIGLEFQDSFPKEKKSLYMLEIAEKLKLQKELVNVIKNAVLEQINTEKYVVADWKMNVLILEKCIEGAADIESAIHAAIENEVINAYTPILYAIERSFAFSSYFSNLSLTESQKTLLRELWIKIFKSLDFEFKLEKSDNKLRIEFLLDFPFSQHDYQTLNLLYPEYTASLKTESKKSDKESETEHEILKTFYERSILTSRMQEINADSMLQRLYMSDLVRMDLLNHDFQQSLEIIYNALAVQESQGRPPDIDVRVLSFLKYRSLGKLVCEAFQVLHIMGLSNIVGDVIQEKSDSEDMIGDIIAIFDEFACKITPTAKLLKKMTFTLYLASSENLFDIYVKLSREIGDNEFSNVRLIEFWRLLSSMLFLFGNGQTVLEKIAEKAENIQEPTILFIYNEEFSSFVFKKVEDLAEDRRNAASRREEDRLRFICSYYTLLLNEKPEIINEIAMKLNNSDLWKYSAVLTRKIIVQSGIDAFACIENPKDSIQYLECLEKALSMVGMQNRFAVLLSDSLYKELSFPPGDSMEHFKKNENAFKFLINLLNIPNENFPECKKMNIIVQLNVLFGPYCDLLWKDKLLDDEIKDFAAEVDAFLCQETPIMQTFRLYCVKKMKQLSEKPNSYLWNVLRSRGSVAWTKKFVLSPDITELWPIEKKPLYFETRDQITRIIEGSDSNEFQSLFVKVVSKDDRMQFVLAIVTVLLEKNKIVSESPYKHAHKWITSAREDINRTCGLPVYELLLMLIINATYGSPLCVTPDIDYQLYPLYYFLVILLIHREERHPMTSIFFDAQGNLDHNRFKKMHVYGVEDDPLVANLKHQLDNFDHYFSAKEKAYKCSKCEFVSVIWIARKKCKFCESGMDECEEDKARELMIRNIEKYQATEPLEGYFFKEGAGDYSARPIGIATLKVLHLLLNTTLLFLRHSKMVNEEAFTEMVGTLEAVETVNSAVRKDLAFLSEIIGGNMDLSHWLLALLEDFPQLLAAQKTDSVTHRDRAEFERNFDQKVKTMISNSTAVIFGLKKRYLGTDELELFVEEVASPSFENCELLRICKQPSFHQVKSLFFSMNEERRSHLGMLNTYFLREAEFRQLLCLNPLVQLTNQLLKKFNHKFARDQISELISDELQKDENLRTTFSTFKTVWNKFMQVPLEFNNEMLPPHLFEESDSLLWFLVDSRDRGRHIAAALIRLSNIQNNLLSVFSAFLSKQRKREIAYIDPTVYSVQSIKPEMVLQVNLGNPQEMEQSYVSTSEYGMGKQLLYDFDRFQRLMVMSFKKAKWLSNSNVQFVHFQFELQGEGLIASVRKLIKQTPFNHTVVKNLLKKEESNSTLLRNLYTSLDIILYHIKLKQPSESTIEDFCKSSHISKIDAMDASLTGASQYSQISLSQIVGFYEFVEELYFPHYKKYVADSYNENNPSVDNQVSAVIEKSKKADLGLPSQEAMLAAMKRFIIRCLSQNLNSKDLLSIYIGREDLWENGFSKKCLSNLAKEWQSLVLANTMQVFNVLEKHGKAAENPPPDDNSENPLNRPQKPDLMQRLAKDFKKAGRRGVESSD